MSRVASPLSIDRVWQWAWDRHGPSYSWMVLWVSYVVTVPIWMTSAVFVVAFEESDWYAGAVVAAAAAALVTVLVLVRPGFPRWRPIERYASGEPVDVQETLESTYTLARSTIVEGFVSFALSGGSMAVLIGALVGAEPIRLGQYFVWGMASFAGLQMIAIHSFPEGFMRPVRAALTADSADGDSLPRSRPSFATWSSVTVLGTAWVFAIASAIIAVVIDRAAERPVWIVLIATGLTLTFAVPITVGAAFAPSLRPIRDLAEGTERVAAGDYTQRLPVVQDDDLGALAASFNRMQAGLAERERLRAAFGSYVDPVLANRLLDQGDDVFTGERREVTVMFVDIRDFTPFAEAHPAEDTVAHLNALFEIVVPSVLDVGGHVNKYLGDGALAVFGAPNALEQHADAAVAAAVLIQRRVTDRFGGELRIGIGVNTGIVIAGTIGGGGKLEFTLIGDTVNVAARIEQLTKTTGDTILLTQSTVDSLTRAPAGLTDRGSHDVKGKATTVRVHALV